ncbi:unnamed protein product [Dracunculus medinensis]|uniref:CNDH2_C domain-containing protein n=1 Tax=Dracunculus medinensis TaxID=318479 RepID=A0A0N4UK04_DRAME|nr:unnamed protein product [Dracunculus medinensis]
MFIRRIKSHLFLLPCKNGSRIAEVRFTFCSMRNAYGLRFLYLFFNIPFLYLQRETLLGQLKRNEREIELSCKELNIYEETAEADYNQFIEALTAKRRIAVEKIEPLTTGGNINVQLPLDAGQPISSAAYDLNDGYNSVPAYSSKNTSTIINENFQNDTNLSSDLNTVPKMSSSSDENVNKMVAVYEEDYSVDDHEHGSESSRKSSRTNKIFSDFILEKKPPDTPIAYRVQLFESRPVSPIFNPHKNVSIVHPEIDDIMQVTFTSDDLDAWLGDPVTLATDEFEIKDDNSDARNCDNNPLVTSIPVDSDSDGVIESCGRRVDLLSNDSSAAIMTKAAQRVRSEKFKKTSEEKNKSSKKKNNRKKDKKSGFIIDNKVKTKDPNMYDAI